MFKSKNITKRDRLSPDLKMEEMNFVCGQRDVTRNLCTEPFFCDSDSTAGLNSSVSTLCFRLYEYFRLLSRSLG